MPDTAPTSFIRRRSTIAGVIASSALAGGLFMAVPATAQTVAPSPSAPSTAPATPPSDTPSQGTRGDCPEKSGDTAETPSGSATTAPTVAT